MPEPEQLLINAALVKIWDALDYWWEHAPVIPIDDSSRWVFIGDMHMEDGLPPGQGGSDDFKGHEDLFIDTINEHVAQGFRIGEGGDGRDAWEMSNERKFALAYPDIHQRRKELMEKGIWVVLPGNHNPNRKLPQAYKFIHKTANWDALWLHGHQGTWANDRASWFGQGFVKYIWRPMQMWLWLPDPSSARPDVNPNRHREVTQAYELWAATRKRHVIYHHTHSMKVTEWSANAGCWVGQDKGGNGVQLIGREWTPRYFG